MEKKVEVIKEIPIEVVKIVEVIKEVSVEVIKEVIVGNERINNNAETVSFEINYNVDTVNHLLDEQDNICKIVIKMKALLR